MRTLVATGWVALLCNLALEIARLEEARNHPWDAKTAAYPLLFLLGTAVVWLVVGLVHAVVGRLWATTALVATATAVVAVVDREKARLNGEPLLPGDLELAGNVGFLAQMLGARVLLLGALVVALAAALTLVGVRALGRRSAETGHVRRPWYVGLGRRVGTALLCLLGLAYLGQFNASGNGVRGAYELLGASWGHASQQAVYLGNGFVGGFLYNLDVPAITPPRGYNRATMARIAGIYTAAARRINAGRDPRALDDVNVVIVLSESFSDPTRLDGLEVPGDPIPYTRRLMSSTTSGQMLTPALGGKTANVEFEALTGMSMSGLPPQLQVPYNALVSHRRTFPSAVGWWKRHGHSAVAIHPYTTELYSREEVYRTLGFDRFVSEPAMTARHRIGNNAFISDASAFGEVVHQLRSHTEPTLVHLVTMQNHLPYAGRYDDPWRVASPDGEALADVGQYVRGLTHSDAAVRGFVARLRAMDEKTVVVFYGDHLPGIYPETVREGNGALRMHQTPFFVWANFPGQAQARPTTSPVHFMSLALERADAPVPPYYALLDRLRARLPAFDQGIYLDAADHRVRPADLGPRAVRLLHHYRLVQYDLAAGRRYSEDAMFALPRCHGHRG